LSLLENCLTAFDIDCFAIGQALCQAEHIAPGRKTFCNANLQTNTVSWSQTWTAIARSSGTTKLSTNLEFELRRISDDRGGAARWSNKASFGYFIQYTFAGMMIMSELIKEIVSVYQKHGWQLRRVLLRPESQMELEGEISSLGEFEPDVAAIDALWFSRPSHQAREAWELRLIAENPYALFETFEADESDEEREDVRREMEARMREYLKKSDE
jgi:hypothetical protein